MDFSTEKSSISFIIDGILHLKLLSSIPLKERLNKGVISDAYKTYLTMPEEYFSYRTQSSIRFM